jgi:hypothetical protein
VFQNPELFPTQVSLSPEESTSVINFIPMTIFAHTRSLERDMVEH